MDITSKRRFGDVPTRLHLTEKAMAYYIGTDPISIYECETADGALLYILDDGAESEPMTESELIKCLESAYDELPIDVQFDATPDGNLLHVIHPDITARVWCPVPEGASDDYGYLTLKKAMIAGFPGNPDRLNFWYDGQEDKLDPDASADCTVYTDFGR